MPALVSKKLMRQWFFLLLATTLITGCDSFGQLFEKKDYCIVQTGEIEDGHTGSYDWSPEMSREECRAKCSPVFRDVVLNNTWGYCRFGDTDNIWNINQELQDQEAREWMESVPPSLDDLLRDEDYYDEAYR